jgi:hypothetical protein
MLKRDALIAAALVTCLSGINTSWAEEITVENAWVRSAPPVATVLAGYMTIQNHSDKAITLTAVNSPAFESVELHRTTLHGGMMHMEAIKFLVIEGNSSVKLEPNSYHLMLNNPKQKISTGDTIQFSLNFDGATKQVSATVKQDDEQDSAHHHHHHH